MGGGVTKRSVTGTPHVGKIILHSIRVYMLSALCTKDLAMGKKSVRG